MVSTKLNELIAEYEEYFMEGGIQQSLQDLESLVEELGDRKFNNMVEIGIADGGTLWLYTQLFGTPGAKVTVVDMDIRAVTARVIAALEEKGFIFKVIMDQSMNVKLEGPIDFLHIDGDHSYESLSYDYLTHSPLVIPGGLIIIHDTMLMEGPIRVRKQIEQTSGTIKTFCGTDTMCDCYGRGRINPDNKAFGLTLVYK